MMPLVSVLMPVWNADQPLLRIAVESVLGQTLKDIELIIVEDPSDCPATALLAQFHDPRIRHFENEQRTDIVRQLNRGLGHCRGELVARFDADDICRPHRLATQVGFLMEHRAVSVVGSQISVIDDAGREIGHREYPRTHERIIRAMHRFNPLAHPSVMFRRDPIVNAGGYRDVPCDEGNLPWCQDYELWSRMAAEGVQFANHPETLIQYRVHRKQVKARRVRDVIRAYLKIKEQYWRGTMQWTDRRRMDAEKLLLWLPPKLVLSLFHRLQIAR